MKKLLPPALFLISILIMMLLWRLVPINRNFTFPVSLAGLALLILGLGLTILGSRKFQQVGTNINTFNEPDVLVKDGLFRYSRNPMYLGFVIALLGVSALLGSLSTLAVVIVFFVITDRWYIAFEERAMAKKFGEEYEKYKSQTRRWI